MENGDLIVVHTYGNQAAAELAKTALAAAGIDAMIRSDSFGGVGPHIAFSTGGFKLVVREEDEAEARDILELPARLA